MKSLAAVSHGKDILVVAKDKKTLDKSMSKAIDMLGQQAAIASQFTGLSVQFCSKMILHRAARRMRHEYKK